MLRPAPAVLDFMLFTAAVNASCAHSPAGSSRRVRRIRATHDAAPLLAEGRIHRVLNGRRGHST